MRILEEELRNKTIDFIELLKYGFTQENEIYSYHRKIYDEQFEMNVTVANNKMTAKLLIDEYSDIKETSMNTTHKEIEYSPFQMLAFCIGWMDLVLSWEDEEQKGIQKTTLATEWKWNDLDWLYQSFYNKYNKASLDELINIFNQKVKNMIELITNLSDEELLEVGKRNWAKTNGKEFSIYRLIHLNTIANFKNFRSRIRSCKKNNNQKEI